MENFIFERVKKLRNILKEKDLDALMILKRENYLYLSGFNGTNACLLITQSKLILLTDSRYIYQAKEQAKMYEIIECNGLYLDALNTIIKDNNIRKLGFESEFITFERYIYYKENLKVENLVPVKEMIEQLRKIKDIVEIEKIKNAVRIADQAFLHILNYIKPGVSEIEIAAEIEFFMRKQGAKGSSFETIVASGLRSALPHGVASDKVIQQNDTIVLDFGAVYDDYCSDITRTVFVGKPIDPIKNIYDIVLKAQISAIEAIREGFTGKEIDDISRNIISNHGYGEYFGHGLGHGVGICVHEDPRISPFGNEKVIEKMVFTVEPGIYLNDLGGVRIEDMIVIQDGIANVLTQSLKDMIII